MKKEWHSALNMPEERRSLDGLKSSHHTWVVDRETVLGKVDWVWGSQAEGINGESYRGSSCVLNPRAPGIFLSLLEGWLGLAVSRPVWLKTTTRRSQRIVDEPRPGCFFFFLWCLSGFFSRLSHIWEVGWQRAGVQRHGPVVCLEKSVLLCCFVFVFQFNYMHECFERVFCELKWRKEVILNNLELTFSSFCVLKMIWPDRYLGPSVPSESL